MEKRIFTDSSCNRVVVHSVSGTNYLSCKLASDFSHGYIAENLGFGGFGDENCPSSYGRPCIFWFGPGETFKNYEEGFKFYGIELPAREVPKKVHLTREDEDEIARNLGIIGRDESLWDDDDEYAKDCEKEVNAAKDAGYNF